MPDPVKVFVSYAREDSKHRKSLRSALAVLEMTNLVEIWSDRAIAPGEDWDEKIDEKIRSSDLVIFLLSSDFMSSGYIMGKEYRVATERKDNDNVKIVPVFVRKFNAGGHRLRKMNMIPRDPQGTEELLQLSQWSDPDAFWTEVSREIESVARNIQGTGTEIEKTESASIPEPIQAGESEMATTKPEQREVWELRRIAGSGAPGNENGTGPAKAAQFLTPVGIAEVNGEIYVSDRQTCLIRKIDSSGDISPVAEQQLCEQLASAYMCSDRIYLAGGLMRCVRSLELESREVNDIVPPPPYEERGRVSGDGGPAEKARFAIVSGIAAISEMQQELFVSDSTGHTVRHIALRKNGHVTLFAGNGTKGYSGDHGPADRAQLCGPTDLAFFLGGVLGENYLYIADTGNHVIRRVRLSDGEISTVAGTGRDGFGGDGGPAIEALLSQPSGIAVRGNEIFISDTGNHRVRKIDGAGDITTIAGTGQTGYPGDSRDATQSDLWFPRGIAAPRHLDRLYVCDTGHHRVVALSPNRNYR